MKSLVVVAWADAWQDQENFVTLHGIQSTHKPMPVQTIGWLLLDDEVGVSVANERSTDGDAETYRGRTFIPRAMVQTVTPFKMTKPRKPKSAEEINVEPTVRV